MKRLKGALRGAGPAAPPDPAAAEQLAALLRGLGACVSLLHERRHEVLLKDLLDTPLWQVPQVGAGAWRSHRWLPLPPPGPCIRAGSCEPSALTPRLPCPACPAPMQALRLALLDWVTHVVVANGSLVQSCLQTLVYSLLPPPGPPLPDPNPGEAWAPSEGQAAVQDEVLAASHKVGAGAAARRRDCRGGERRAGGRAQPRQRGRGRTQQQRASNGWLYHSAANSCVPGRSAVCSAAACAGAAGKLAGWLLANPRWLAAGAGTGLRLRALRRLENTACSGAGAWKPLRQQPAAAILTKS